MKTVNTNERLNSNKKPSGTQEWAAHNVNIQAGCEHDCKYCYAKSMAIRFGRATPQSWKQPEILHDKVSKDYRKMDGRIMFPTSHDITPLNIEECSIVLSKLLEAGNEVLIVSKPHLKCIKKLCSDLAKFKDKILFRFTIGSTDDYVLRFWEPEAPSFKERLSCLKYAFQKGFQTSVSCEPMLDERIDRVIAKAKPYVTDAIWLGRVNRIRSAIAQNCPNDKTAKKWATLLLGYQHDDWIRDLYEKYKTDSTIKWKDSIKKVIGISRPTEKGLDV